MYKNYSDHGYADYQGYMQIPDASVASLTALEGSNETDSNNKRFARLVYNINESGGVVPVSGAMPVTIKVDGEYVDHETPLPVSVTSEVQKFRDGFNYLDSSLWDVVSGTNDHIAAYGNTGGASYLQISKSIFNDDNATTFLSKTTFDYPTRFAVGFSASQRIGHQQVNIGIVGVDTSGNVESIAAPTPIAISNLSQSTTTLTVDTATAHNLVAGDRVDIYGQADSRFNYCALIVASTPSFTQFTATATALGTITSITASGAATGYVIKNDPLGLDYNAFALSFESTTAANALTFTRSDGGSFKATAAAAIGTTAATQANAATYTDSFLPAHQYDFRLRSSDLIVRGMPISNITTQAGQVKVSDVVPNIGKKFKLKLRFKQHKSSSRIVGAIVSIVKSGSTTWTVTTRAPHGLTSGNYVAIYGNRDTTNFANITTPVVCSVTDDYTFTCAGTTGTATGYGGVVVLVNGSVFSNVTPGTMSIQSMSRTGNVLTVIGSANWTGFTVAGETVRLFGLTGTAGEDYSQYEGVYKILGSSTTTMWLSSVGDNFASIDMGGSAIKLTDYRLHYLRLFEYSRTMVDVEGGIGDATDIQDSIPVAVTTGTLSTVTTVTTCSTVTSLSQIATSVPLMAVANGSTNKALGVSMCTAMANTDHSAIAFAGSGRVNGAVVASALGGGVSCAFDISVTVTTLGTATALLFVLQESYDSGTTWSDIWTTQPFTTTQHIRVPALPISGRRRWTMHSVGGTSTTVPATIIAQELPGVALIQRQYVDVYAATNPMQSVINGTSTSTTLVSTTLNSASGVAIVEGCKNITISGVFTGGTPTTNPTYSLQISQDATNWFTTNVNITPTAAGTFMATLQNTSARFARIIVTTASSGGTPYTVTYTAINGTN